MFYFKIQKDTSFTILIIYQNFVYHNAWDIYHLSYRQEQHCNLNKFLVTNNNNIPRLSLSIKEV